jgi:hypothetical protein
MYMSFLLTDETLGSLKSCLRWAQSDVPFLVSSLLYFVAEDTVAPLIKHPSMEAS